MAAKEKLDDPILVALELYNEVLERDAAEKAAFEACRGKVGGISAAFIGKNLELLQRIAAADAPYEVHSRTKCKVCAEEFTSRERLFNHLRSKGHGKFQHCTSLMHAILFDAWETAAELLATGDAANGPKELATADVDTGESPLLVATMKCIVCIKHAKEGSATAAVQTNLARALDVVRTLLALGADPHTRPVQQRYLQVKALEVIGGQNFTRVANLHQQARTAPRRVGEHLAFWSAAGTPRHFFRGSAAEIVAGATAAGLDVSELQSVLGFISPLVGVPPIPRATFQHWCPVCPKGAVLTVPHDAVSRGHQECDECGQFHSCAKCGLPFAKHSKPGGGRISCEEAVCRPLIVGVYRHTYGPNMAYLQRVFTILKHCPPPLVARVKAVLQSGAVHNNVAKAQLNPDTNIRQAAIALLQQHWPDEVLLCTICDESYNDFAPVQPCVQGSARFAKVICNHTFCQGCLSDWVASTVHSGRHKCFCPDTKCNAQLYPDDIKRVAGAALYAEHMALIKTDHRGRLLEAMESGVGLEKDPACRACPSCRVVIFRFSGCDDFICSCSHRFNFTKAAWPTIAALKSELAASG